MAVPLVGCSTVLRIRRAVVLPAPFGPKQSVDLARQRREADSSSSATNVPAHADRRYAFVRARTSIMRNLRVSIAAPRIERPSRRERGTKSAHMRSGRQTATVPLSSSKTA